MISSREGGSPEPPEVAASSPETGADADAPAPGYCFISYSRADGVDFARGFLAGVEREASFRVWFDNRDLRPFSDWDVQAANAIKGCQFFVFLMTDDSVLDNSVCRIELTYAWRYRKQIVPIQAQDRVELPFLLGNHQFIRFAEDLDGMAREFVAQIAWFHSPEGQLHQLKTRRLDAERDRVRVPASEQLKVDHEIAELDEQIAHVTAALEDPHGAERRAMALIRGDIRRRSRAQPTVARASRYHARIPFALPATPPAYFQDRHAETEVLFQFLRDPQRRLITVMGRGGIGKTTVVCRVLKKIEEQESLEGHLPVDADGMLYLSSIGRHQVNAPNLIAGLLSILPAPVEETLRARFSRSEVNSRQKMLTLLDEFRSLPCIVLLDNFEALIDPESQRISDSELLELLTVLLEAPEHRVKVVLTTRVVAVDLALVAPGAQFRLDLEHGLAPADAAELLRQMDADGSAGFKRAPDALLHQAALKTAGYPKALLALFGIVSLDRGTLLEEVLAHEVPQLPGNVVDAFVGEAYSRLAPGAQLVMQAVAVFGRPVSEGAVAYLLQPYIQTVDTPAMLRRLVNMRFITREGGFYHLHPSDRAFALSRLPKRDASPVSGGPPQPTQMNLLLRAADYFAATRKPAGEWLRLDGLAPQLAEFELRYAADDFDEAARVLMTVDYDYLSLLGYNHLVRDSHLQLKGKLVDRQLALKSLQRLGRAEFLLSGYERAAAVFEEALSGAREAGDNIGEAWCLSDLGYCHFYLGRYDRAIADEQRALAIIAGVRASTDVDLVRLRAHGILAFAHSAIGHTDTAVHYAIESLALAESAGNKRERSTQLSYLGLYRSYQGRTVEARKCYADALAVAEETHGQFERGLALGLLCEVQCQEGNFAESERSAEECARIERQVTSAQLGSWCYWWLAVARAHLGKENEALEAARTAIGFNEPLNNPNALAFFAIMSIRNRDLPGAAAAYEQVFEKAKVLLESSDRNWEVLLAAGLGRSSQAVALKGVGVDEAIALFNRAFDISDDAGHFQRVLLQIALLEAADAGGTVRVIRDAVLARRDRAVKSPRP